MKPKVYVETSVVSYCTSNPSRDLVIAGRQQVTREWWGHHRHHFDLYISAMVLQETRKGDPSASIKREGIVKGISLLEITEAARDLADTLIHKGPIPRQFPEDALHIAIAVVHEMNFLLTWNFKHINNAQIKNDLSKIITLEGFDNPVICTPEELLGD